MQHSGDQRPRPRQVVSQVRSVSHLLEHLVLRLGPDVQLKNTQQVWLVQVRQEAPPPSAIAPPPHLPILIVNILVVASNHRPVDEERTHHHDGLQHLPQGHLEGETEGETLAYNSHLFPQRGRGSQR